MKKASVHYNWLRLIEVSGPFVSATALDEAFSNGLDGLDKGVKRQLSRYYDEWLDAMEANSPYFEQLHAAWCEAVLREGLEFRENDLESANSYVAKDDAGIGTFTADKVLKDDAGKPLFFVKFLSSKVRPGDRDVSDDWKDSCIEKMTRLCRMHDVRVGLVTNGEQWVLVNAASGGSLSGSATWYARLWFQEDETLRAFISLLGFRRFVGAPKKRLPYLLDESLKHLEEVTDTLGKQVMAAVEVLLEGFDRADLDANRTLLADVAPQELYEASLTVMMRLIFLLCAEERGLMLLGEKKYDDVYAVSTLRNKLENDADRYGPQVLERRFDAWARLLSVFRAVFAGIDHSQLKLAAMGGSLFDPDKYPFLEGRSKDERWRNDNPPPLPIDNRTVLHLLESLQVLNHKNGAIQLSFRSLDVEQIGYIYEGLLEFTAKKASETLIGLKGDKSHLNPEIALSELESLAMDSKEKLFVRVKELTGRSALAREYTRETDESLMPQLVKVCRGDESLKSRVLPYLNWIRLSAWGEPVVYHKDSFYVTEGTDRRSSGTHYTPRALTEMIVREALESVVYDGPAKGTPRAEWKLKSPSELLDLKVCDPAMGSGAFLVQTCRYLGDRLVEAWAAAEKDGKAVASNGTVTEFPPNDPMSNLLDDRICEARRLVAEKCLYGVDINPLAVELAKLSLWLVTISKGRPFGFLDHNLKSGDSLLGVSDIKQLIQFRMKPSSAPFGNLLTTKIESAVAEALKEREAIRSGRSRDINDVALLQQHYRKAEELTRRIKEYADFFIGEVLVAGKPGKKNDAKLDAAAMEGADLIDGDTLNVVYLHNRTKANLAYDLPAGQTAPRRPFHWAIEFPEVFAQGGFNAIVGNPPYVNAVTLSSGDNKRSILKDFYQAWYKTAKGSFDLYIPFYERSLSLIKNYGIVGLLIPNKVLSIDYAESLRALVLEIGSVKTILDFSKGHYFQASVYTVALISIKNVNVDTLVRIPQSEIVVKVSKQLLQSVPDHLWGFVITGESDLFVRLLENTVPLSSVAMASGTATVSEAYEIAPLIVENKSPNQDIPKGFVKFIVSGNIRGGYTTWGCDKVQYLKHSYAKPIVQVSRLPANRAKQAIQTKIAISGLASRPTAFFDEYGTYYPGKSTVIITAESKALLARLTTLLNSKIGRIIYHAQYGSLSLQGGYMRFGPPQLNRFPIPAGFELLSQELTDTELCKLYGVSEDEIDNANKKLDEEVNYA